MRLENCRAAQTFNGLAAQVGAALAVLDELFSSADQLPGEELAVERPHVAQPVQRTPGLGPGVKLADRSEGG